MQQTYLAIGHHVEVSTLSGRGDRCIPYPGHYSPAFACSTFLYPQRLRLILQPDLSHVAVRLRYGLALFRAVSTSQEDPAFLPVIVASACPHQAGRHPITYRFGQSLSVDLALSSFTAFIGGSRTVGPLTQPSASTESRLPVSRDDPHGPCAPMGWLHCRCASNRVVANPALHLGYRWLNIGSRFDLAVARQLTARLAPRLTPDLVGDEACGPRASSGAACPHLSGVVGPADRRDCQVARLGS